MYYEIVTSSDEHVLSLEDIKRDFVPITHNSHDQRLEMLRNAAESFVENETRRILITKTIDVYFDQFDDVRIPLRPNVVVSSVEYRDGEGTLTEVSAPSFHVDAHGLDTAIRFASTPSVGCYSNAVTIRCTAGYGTTAADVPDLLRSAVGFLVVHWYNQPEPVLTGTILALLPFHIQAILDQYRIVEV